MLFSGSCSEVKAAALPEEVQAGGEKVLKVNFMGGGEGREDALQAPVQLVPSTMIIWVAPLERIPLMAACIILAT